MLLAIAHNVVTLEKLLGTYLFVTAAC